jgi:hypothetical protein
MALRERRTLPRLAGLPLCATVLGAIVLASIAVGAKAIPLERIASTSSAPRCGPRSGVGGARAGRRRDRLRRSAHALQGR